MAGEGEDEGGKVDHDDHRREAMVHRRDQVIPKDDRQGLEGKVIQIILIPLFDYFSANQNLSYQGVPDKMRGTVWRILLNVDNAKMKQQGIYNKMK